MPLPDFDTLERVSDAPTTPDFDTLEPVKEQATPDFESLKPVIPDDSSLNPVEPGFDPLSVAPSLPPEQPPKPGRIDFPTQDEMARREEASRIASEQLRHTPIGGSTESLLPKGTGTGSRIARAVLAPVSGVGDYLRSPQGIVESAAATTVLAPIMQAKWALDMGKGAYDSANRIIDAFSDPENADLNQVASDVGNFGAGVYGTGKLVGDAAGSRLPKDNILNADVSDIPKILRAARSEALNAKTQAQFADAAKKGFEALQKLKPPIVEPEKPATPPADLTPEITPNQVLTPIEKGPENAGPVPENQTVVPQIGQAAETSQANSERDLEQVAPKQHESLGAGGENRDIPSEVSQTQSEPEQPADVGEKQIGNSVNKPLPIQPGVPVSLELLHGSAKEIPEGQFKKGEQGYFGPAVYFGTHENGVAGYYGKKTPYNQDATITKAIASLQKPFDFRFTYPKDEANGMVNQLAEELASGTYYENQRERVLGNALPLFNKDATGSEIYDALKTLVGRVGSGSDAQTTGSNLARLLQERGYDAIIYPSEQFERRLRAVKSDMGVAVFNPESIYKSKTPPDLSQASKPVGQGGVDRDLSSQGEVTPNWDRLYTSEHADILDAQKRIDSAVKDGDSTSEKEARQERDDAIQRLEQFDKLSNLSDAPLKDLGQATVRALIENPRLTFDEATVEGQRLLKSQAGDVAYDAALESGASKNQAKLAAKEAESKHTKPEVQPKKEVVPADESVTPTVTDSDPYAVGTKHDLRSDSHMGEVEVVSKGEKMFRGTPSTTVKVKTEKGKTLTMWEADLKRLSRPIEEPSPVTNPEPPQTKVGGKSEIKVVNPSGVAPYGGGIVTVKGSDLTLSGAPEHEFFVYKTSDKGPWRVVEKKTGRGVGDATGKTRAEAVAKAEHVIGAIQPDAINKALERQDWINAEKPEPKPAEPIGMGGAVPSEFGGGANPDVYGVAERVRQARAKAGQVADIPPGEGISAPDSVERGRELLNKGTDPEAALKNFEATKRLSADDMAVVRAKGEELALAARRIEEKFGTHSPEYKLAWDALSKWDERSKAMQTEWHRTGQAQQGETDIDTGSFTGLQRAYKDVSGKDFTPKQAKDAKTVAQRVTKADSEAVAATEKLYKAADAEPIDPKVKSIADRIIAALDKSADSALARIKRRRSEGRLFMSIDPTELADYAIYGASKIAKGFLEKSRWAAAMIKDIGDYIEPHLDQIWKAANDHANRVISEAVQPEMREPVKQAITKVAKTISPDAAKGAFDDFKSGSKMNPQQVKSLWQLAKEYINKGETDFDNIRNRLATDLGLKVDDVTKGLTQNQTVKRLADDAWRKQQSARRVKEQAKRWLNDAEFPGYRKALNAIPKIMFSLKVGFHGTVALGTHAPMVAFQPPFWANYAKNFIRMYRMVGSPGFYERTIQDLQRRDNYTTARRAGLVNDPYQYEEYQNPQVKALVDKLLGDKLSEKLQNLTTMGNRGYAVLKVLRQDMFDQMWNNLPESAKVPEVATAIADGLNHATGVVKGKAPPGSNLALFAPRLMGSRAMWLAGDPARAGHTFMDWKNAKPEEKIFAMNQLKEKAWVVGTLMSMLAINQGILSASNSKQKINFTNPMRSDFLKFKGAGMDYSYGNAMLAMARLPARLWVGIKNEGKLNKIVYEDENTYKILGDYLRSQMSPFAGTAADLAFGRDFEGRPLPRAGFGFLPERTSIPKRLREQGTTPYTWDEYWARQLTPIPVSEGLKEVWGKGMGMNEKDMTRAAKAMASIAIMGATGGRVSEDFYAGKDGK